MYENKDDNSVPTMWNDPWHDLDVTLETLPWADEYSALVKSSSAGGTCIPDRTNIELLISC